MNAATKLIPLAEAPATPDPEHYWLSCSGAAMWMACPASAALQPQYPDTASDAADEGTRFHKVMEYLVDRFARGQRTLDPAELVGCTVGGVEVTPEFAEWADYCLHVLRERIHPDAILYPEQRLHIPVTGGFGTVDVLALHDQRLIVIDWKSGYKQVQATNNPQLRLYALGALHQLSWADVADVEMVIVQPRHRSDDHETIPVADLQLWEMTRAAPAVTAACLPDAPRVPGEKQCTWCRARFECRARAEHVAELALDGFNAVTVTADAPVSLDKLTTAEIGAYLNLVPMVRAFCDDLEKAALSLRLQGIDVPGWKLVEGRANRQWADEDRAAAALAPLFDESDLYKRSFLSPAQAEKLVGRKHADLLATLISKPQGKPTLAPASDKRPALDVSAPAEGFAAVGGGA